MFENSKWIWCTNTAKADEYGDFYTEFDYSNGSLTLNVSADSNYAVFLNGKLVAFGQYADFPYDKIYDSVDISEYAVLGKNRLAITVWYYGIDTTQVYYPGNASLIFEVRKNSEVISKSDENILSRISPLYKNHYNKIITGQLGLSFFYDAVAEDNWTLGNIVDFTPSTIVNQELPLRIRPCKRLVLAEPCFGTEIKRFSDTNVLYDLGTNNVGFLTIETESDCEQTLLISYGEHIEDGRVRRNIWIRDFSVEIKVKKGKTMYANPFRRLGCRYLEIFSEGPIKAKIGIIPTMYPVAQLPAPTLSKSEQEIYDISVRTLRLCMHEHYEDCPWREQALYTMDSRNQMLFGYYAFGEYEFPRANLQLISKDNRKDGQLSICYPMKADLVIPSFSLHYFTSCLEYYCYSKDITLLKEVFPKLKNIIKTFTAKMETIGDVILPFENGWNFYEWRNGLDGNNFYNKSIPDLPLNALLSIALRNMGEICKILGEIDEYTAISRSLNANINKTFYDQQSGMYFNQADTKVFSKLSNSLAILCGATSENQTKHICEKMVSDESLTEITLSMQTFYFDALLSCDKEKYADYILSQIEEKYRPMVEYGVGTVWETELGQSDFKNAGSLCHGWSALPIYYYHILKK